MSIDISICRSALLATHFSSSNQSLASRYNSLTGCLRLNRTDFVLACYHLDIDDVVLVGVIVTECRRRHLFLHIAAFFLLKLSD